MLLLPVTNPTLHLAALGGAVLPITLIIESPIIMLLTASTALAGFSQQAYRLINRFMMWTGFIITIFHAFIQPFTPIL